MLPFAEKALEKGARLGSRVREPDLRPSRLPIDAENVVAVRGASRKRKNERHWDDARAARGGPRRCYLPRPPSKRSHLTVRRPPNALLLARARWRRRRVVGSYRGSARGARGARSGIVAPLNLRWYNEVAPATARVAPRRRRRGGRARGSWSGTAARCGRRSRLRATADPAIGDAEHPVDTFVARAIRDAIADARRTARRRFGRARASVRRARHVPGKLVAIRALRRSRASRTSTRNATWRSTRGTGRGSLCARFWCSTTSEGRTKRTDHRRREPAGYGSAPRARASTRRSRRRSRGARTRARARSGGRGGSPCATPCLRKRGSRTRSGTTRTRCGTTTTARRAATRARAYGTACERTEAFRVTRLCVSRLVR